MAKMSPNKGVVDDQDGMAFLNWFRMSLTVFRSIINPKSSAWEAEAGEALSFRPAWFV